MEHYDQVEASELEQKISVAIEGMPPERRKIFIMSRYDGLKYNEIADQLGISIDTIRTYLRRIYEKLHVQSRTEAVAKYMRL